MYLPEVILLTAKWCSVCPAAKALWRELKATVSFDYHEVDVESIRGQELVERYSISSVPTSILDGKVVLHGVPVRSHAEQLLARDQAVSGALP